MGTPDAVPTSYDRETWDALVYRDVTDEERAEVRERIRAQLAANAERRAQPGYWDRIMRRAGIRVDPAA